MAKHFGLPLPHHRDSNRSVSFKPSNQSDALGHRTKVRHFGYIAPYRFSRDETIWLALSHRSEGEPLPRQTEYEFARKEAIDGAAVSLGLRRY